MALLWSEKQVLLAERIIPTGIMARSQVTLDMALRWSAGIWIYRILLTWRSSGSKNELRNAVPRGTFIALVIHSLDLLDCDPQTNSLRYKRVTCRKNYSDRDNGALSIGWWKRTAARLGLANPRGWICQSSPSYKRAVLSCRNSKFVSPMIVVARFIGRFGSV